MKFKCMFSKYINEKYNDHWQFQIVEGNTKDEAFEKLIAEHNRDGKKINYVLSMEEVKNGR